MNCIIVHGCPSEDRSKNSDYILSNEKHWIPWLKNELEKNEIKTFAPLMPTPWKPMYEEWKDIFEKLPINEDSILIGHSCGGTFLIRWLGETEKKIAKLILVSPGKITINKNLKDFYPSKINPKIRENVQKIIIITAEDDHKSHISGAYEYQKEIGGELIRFGKGYGHFLEFQMGIKEFPEILKMVLE